MKKILFLYILLLGTVSMSFAQTKTKKLKERLEDKIEKYYFVMLKTGPNDSTIDSVKREKLFKGHMANINRLYYDGIIKAAGPFGKNDFTWRGLFVFDCKNREEAEKIIQTDPAVAAGMFSVDIVAWLTSPIGSFKHGKPKKPTLGK